MKKRQRFHQCLATTDYKARHREMKRGRPKGATAYPENAVCIKCGVFRPKRKGYCDTCRPRNRGGSANQQQHHPRFSIGTQKAQQNVTTAPGHQHLHHHDPYAVFLRQSTATLEKPLPLSKSKRPAMRALNAAGREKRQRTTTASNAPSTIDGRQTSLEQNNNVDVVSMAGPTSARVPDIGRQHAQKGSHTTNALHQLALLLPRPDGSADVVPLSSLLAHSGSPAISTPSSGLSSPYHSQPTSPLTPHPLVSLANASIMRSSPGLSSPSSSPLHHHSSASPTTFPSSQPSSSTSSSFPQMVESLSEESESKRMVLPRLSSLQLPRPALPRHFQCPTLFRVNPTPN